MEKFKLAILTSHTVQYQTPLFKKLAEKIDLTVYFCWNFGMNDDGYDEEFGKKLKWDIPLLNGYKYKFLKNFSLKPSSGFFGQINFGIINELRKNKHDAILIFGWNSFTNWLAFFTAFAFKIPVMLRGENPLNQELLKSKWKVRIKKVILGNLFKHISTFLYIGEENKKFYQYYGVPENKLFFVPYAIDNDRFIKASTELRAMRQSLKNKIGIEENSTTILFVGKLIDKKRPMDLLKAYELLAQSSKLNQPDKVILAGAQSSLLFVGDGALRPELEKYANENNLENVIFAGFKNQTELPEYYVVADIFVLPSGEGETWGLVVNEAMCFGLPVIVSNMVGCGPDLIRQGENGHVFQIGSVDELAKKMEIIFDKSQMKKFGEKSFEVIKNYSFDNDVNKVAEIMGNLKIRR